MKLKTYLIILIPLLAFDAKAQSFQLERKVLPLFEIGAGVGHAELPQYEGSKERRSITLPFPTVIYRGDYLRADEDGGLRSRLKFSDRLEVNGSFGMSLPVDSDAIEVREGMDDLDPLFEIGPGFIYHAKTMTKESPYGLSVNFASRYCATTDLDLTEGRGWVLNPNIYSRIKINEKFSAFLSFSQKWAEKSYQQYYYDVTEGDVRSDRPLYESEGGVLATRWSNFIAYQPTGQMAWAAGMVYANYGNAANRQSPLHVNDENFSVVLAFTYWLYQSEVTIERIKK